MSPERQNPYDLHDVVGKGLPNVITSDNFPDLAPRDVRRYQVQALANNCAHEAQLGNETGTTVETYSQMQSIVANYLEANGEVPQAIAMLRSYEWGERYMQCAREYKVEEALAAADAVTPRVFSQRGHGIRLNKKLLDEERAIQAELDALPKPRVGFSSTKRDEINEYYEHLRRIDEIRSARAAILTLSRQKEEPELPS